MWGCPAIALMQAVARRLGSGKRGDPGNQFILLVMGLQQRPEVNSNVAKQTKVQLALR